MKGINAVWGQGGWLIDPHRKVGAKLRWGFSPFVVPFLPIPAQYRVGEHKFLQVFYHASYVALGNLPNRSFPFMKRR